MPWDVFMAAAPLHKGPTEEGGGVCASALWNFGGRFQGRGRFNGMHERTQQLNYNLDVRGKNPMLMSGICDVNSETQPYTFVHIRDCAGSLSMVGF